MIELLEIFRWHMSSESIILNQNGIIFEPFSFVFSLKYKMMFLLIYLGDGMHMKISSSALAEDKSDLGEHIVFLSISALSTANTYRTESI